jgi:iron(III) transport system substrate-binding protein
MPVAASRRLLVLLTSLVLFSPASCNRSTPGGGEVVVYCSADEEYARQVFDRFTRETGLRVSAVYDTESSKTVGLYQRLRAERQKPQADVFWNAELCRTIQLADEGLAADISSLVPSDLPKRWVDPAGRPPGRVNWAAFGLRARVIICNTKQVAPAEAPRTLDELALPRWRGRVVMANPLFGTTATHVAALYSTLGEQRAGALLRGLEENGIRLVEGNSAVRDIVARGGAAAGLTDTDDALGGIEDGLPIAIALPDQEGAGAFVIPNSVMRIAGGPHPAAAERFVSFLLRPEVEEILAADRGHHIPVRPGVKRPDALKPFDALKAMEVDYRQVAARLPETARRVEEIFSLR